MWWSIWQPKNGGNCEYTVPGEIFTTEHGVKIIGYTDLAARLPAQSSQLYGTNLVNLLKLLCKEKKMVISILILMMWLFAVLPLLKQGK